MYKCYDFGRILLPPANEVCEGYVFTGVCLSTGGRTHLILSASGGMHAPGGYYKMRSMSGRYASYWNAFLLENATCGDTKA